MEKEFGFARQLFDDGLYELAAEQFKDFANKYPSDGNADDALFLAGEAYFKAENFDHAFKAYKELEIVYPQSPKLAGGRFRLAQCQVHQKNFEAAGELFGRVPALHPESEFAPKALLHSGKAFRKSGNKDKALNAFFKLITEHGNVSEKFEAHLEIVEIYIESRQFAEAISHTDGIFRTYGADLNDPRIYVLRAQVFQMLGQDDEALSIYTKLTQQFPGTMEAQRANLYLGSLYERMGDYDKALKYFNTVIANSNAITLLNKARLKKGDILFALSEYGQALANYEKVDSDDKQTKIETKFKIAKIHGLLGNYPSASQLFTELVSMRQPALEDSSSLSEFIERAHFELVEMFVKQGLAKKALDTIENFHGYYSESPRYPLMLFRKAEIIEKHLRQPNRAIRVYDAFLERFPFSAKVDEVQLGIARCYEKLAEYRLAVHEYENYLTRFPAAERFDWVKNRRNTIAETLNLENARGFDKITHLFSRLTDEVEEVNWTYESAKLHYEAKEFEEAIQQFKETLRKSANSVPKDELYFYLGNAYFKLDKKETLLKEAKSSPAYSDSAAISLRFLVSNWPDSPFAEDGYLLLTKIKLDTLSSSANKKETALREAFLEWQNKFSKAEHTDFVLIQLANQIMKSSAPDDSTRFSEALSYYRRIVNDFPDSPFFEEAHFKGAMALSFLGADSTAKKKLESFVHSYSNSHHKPRALMLLAKIERRNGNLDAAIKYLESIQSDYFYSPLAEQARYELGDIHFSRGEYQSALDKYELDTGLAEKKPGSDGAARVKRAKAYEELGDLTSALDNYISFIRENPSHEALSEAKLAVARIARKQKDLSFAKEYYESIAEHAASSQQKYAAETALGDIYFERDLYSEARQHYLTAVTLASDPASERYPSSQSIRCRYKLKQFSAADSDVKVFKRKYDDSEEEEGQFLLDKAHAYMDEKNFELAEKTFKKLKGDFKNTTFAARGEFGLGAVYLITNHTEDALKILTNIPGKYPDSEVTPLSYFNLGDFYYKSQQVENAIGAFKQVLDHPQVGEYHQKAMRYLIKCYNDVQMWDSAIAYAREYLESYPHADDSFSKRIDIAKSLMNLKEYDRAIERFRRLKLSADAETEAEIQFYLAKSYQEMGDFERAASEFLKVKYLTKPTKLPWHVTALFEAADSLLRLGKTAQAKTILRRIIDEEGTGSNFGRFAKQKLDNLEKVNSAVDLN
ncbi:tetratricopeptide repeat protein [candidate division KSB1 bacterium]|nr:tetratricopeptide repeat protein [candidate division KSB1 bacterium]NIR72562.1 tetratricopeptide repeat protein [candidate division KSB1 bacterium]NIS27314.1 tetratricopeptide repeat protein [candidate division KSB1 bacterium]NIT73524.1 tetratricopeptide repeat protein [candidate division KSB1 bacterium]NIU28044.1 tetratricopeptide repeat protein [candidate division KSB1 bacterium]